MVQVLDEAPRTWRRSQVAKSWHRTRSKVQAVGWADGKWPPGRELRFYYILLEIDGF